MRTVTCDKCGYSYTVDELGNNMSPDVIKIDAVDIYSVIASGQHERAERHVRADLCKACRANLDTLYEDILDSVVFKILGWLNKEERK